MQKSLLVLSILFLQIGVLHGQTNQQLIKYTEWETQQREEYFNVVDHKAIKGYKQFERSNLTWEQHLDTQGNMINYAKANVDAIEQLKNDIQPSGPDWDFVGPHGPDFDNSFTTGGVGRVNCIYLYSEMTWFVGSSGGGLWKTENAGIHLPGIADQPWENLTDGFPCLAISGVVVNPTNQNEIYILTGDPYNLELPSIGIYKTTDGGQTWIETSLTFSRDQIEYGYKLIHNPGNFNDMYACTSDGLYHTTDGWVTHTTEINELTYDLEFHPSDTSVIYACTSDRILKLCCNESTFSFSDTGVNETQTGRVELEVTPAQPSLVYAVYIDDDRSLGGIYTSIDEAENWELINTGNYNLSASTDPEDPEDTGLGKYCMALLAHGQIPTSLFYGCVNLWNSAVMGFDGTWAQLSDWQSDSDIHADFHFLEYNPYNGSIIAGTDGGVYVSNDNGDTWSNRNYGLHITEFYQGGVDNNWVGTLLVAGGAQDNGTISSLALDGSSLDERIQGGDGFDVFLNTESEFGLQFYSSSQYGKLYYSGLTDGSFYNGTIYPEEIEPGIENKTNRFHVPYAVDPNNWNALLVGYEDCYYSSNYGEDWVKFWDASSKIEAGVNNEIIAIDYKNSNGVAFISRPQGFEDQIWICSYLPIAIIADDESLWKHFTTTDLGLPSGISLSDLSLMTRTIENIQFGTMAVSLHGYDSLHKVMYIPDMADHPDSVINITYDLPNVPVLCIQQHLDGIYIGTDVGVFFLSLGSVNWVYHNNGMPIVPVTEIIFKETIIEGEMMYVSTYGRGIWRNHLATANPQRYYVDSNATGNNDGTSWENAFSNLNSALNAASPLDSLWIADGTYYPGNSRSSQFNIHGEKLFGGFSGIENSLTERDPSTYISRLSGDIGTLGIPGDNVYRLLNLNSDLENCLLDGLSFSDGYANGANEDNRKGACIYMTTFVSGDSYYYVSNRPYFKNCTFENFYAEDNGGVLYLYDITKVLYEGSSAIPDLPLIFDNCVFRNNQATEGGVIYSYNSEPGDFGTLVGDANFVVDGCTFENNSAENGGAIFINSQGIELTKTFSDITFSGNSSTSHGGAVQSLSDSDGNLTLNFEECTFIDNSAIGYGGATYNYTGTNNSYNILPGHIISNYNNCYFASNTAGQGACVAFNAGSGQADQGIVTATFSGCISENCVADNYGGFLYADVSNANSTGVLNIDQCTITNNDSGINGGAISINGAGSGHGELILNNSIIQNCNSGVGGGIYGEGFAGGFFTMNIDSCSFSSNAAYTGGAITTRSTSGGQAFTVCTNTSFTSNHSNGPSNGSNGGAIHHDNTDGINNGDYSFCDFNINHSNQRSGAVGLDNTDATFEQCTFIGNYSAVNGGVSFFYQFFSGVEHTLTYSDCLFDGNYSLGNGGVLQSSHTSSQSLNIIGENNSFINNYADNGGCFYIGGASPFNLNLASCNFNANDAITSGGNGGAIWIQSTGIILLDTCSFIGNYAGATGGSLYTETSSSDDLVISLTHCTFQNNEADLAGAVYSKNTNSSNLTVDINNCEISDNKAINGVGGVMFELYDYSNIEIDSCLFDGNYSLQSSYSTGALYFKSYSTTDTSFASILNTTFQNNSAAGAAGALHYVSDGSLRSHINRCIFQNNSSNLHGGAIRVYSYANDYAEIDITNTLFDGNVALNRGGAIHFETSTTNSETYGNIDQCIIINNQSGDGGAIHNFCSGSGAMNSLDIFNSTISENFATIKCGGIFGQRTNGTLISNLRNNILWGNVDNDTETDQKQVYLSGTGTINVGNCNVEGTLPAMITNVGNNIFADPGFINVASTNGMDNLPFTFDDGFSLSPNSPSIDQADITFTTSIDIAGTSRPQGPASDIGAYEAVTMVTELCPGDMNADNVVNTSDLLIFMSQFGSSCTGCLADLTNDGAVNTSDLLIFMSQYGQVCE